MLEHLCKILYISCTWQLVSSTQPAYPVYMTSQACKQVYKLNYCKNPKYMYLDTWKIAIIILKLEQYHIYIYLFLFFFSKYELWQKACGEQVESRIYLP